MCAHAEQRALHQRQVCTDPSYRWAQTLSGIAAAISRGADGSAGSALGAAGGVGRRCPAFIGPPRSSHWLGTGYSPWTRRRASMSIANKKRVACWASRHPPWTSWATRSRPRSRQGSRGCRAAAEWAEGSVPERPRAWCGGVKSKRAMLPGGEARQGPAPTWRSGPPPPDQYEMAIQKPRGATEMCRGPASGARLWRHTWTLRW